MCGGDAACCQITLTICYYVRHHHHHHRQTSVSGASTVGGFITGNIGCPIFAIRDINFALSDLAGCRHQPTNQPFHSHYADQPV